MVQMIVKTMQDLTFTNIALSLNFTPENFALLWKASEPGYGFANLVKECGYIEDSYFLLTTSIGIIVGFNGRAMESSGIMKFEEFFFNNTRFQNILFEFVLDNGIFYNPIEENWINMTITEIEVFGAFSED